MQNVVFHTFSTTEVGSKILTYVPVKDLNFWKACFLQFTDWLILFGLKLNENFGQKWIKIKIKEHFTKFYTKSCQVA